MKRFERILFCLDRLEHAEPKMVYVSEITRLAESREVHLLHVQDDSPRPALATEAEPAPITVETMEACAEEHLAGRAHAQVICAIVKGSPLVEILRYAHEKDIDLIVLGRVSNTGVEDLDEALLARRLTRKATCSVLVLPLETRIEPTGEIIAPIRDSECSANALEMAAAIASATGYELICLNVFQVTGGYSNVGMSLEEHQAALRENAEKETESLLARVPVGNAKIRSVFVPDLYDRPVPLILQAAQEQKADLIVIGARGLTGPAGVLLASTTENLIRESPVPVLAVKKKGESIGIVQALLTIAGQG
jgi:nucleotide-binding universal stress UspA family protein